MKWEEIKREHQSNVSIVIMSGLLNQKCFTHAVQNACTELKHIGIIKNLDVEIIMINDLNDYYWLSRGKLRSEILLRFLINSKPLSSIDLKRRLGDIEMSTITFTLRELSNDKKIGHSLIKCVTPNEHKNRYYEITEKGKEVIDFLLDEIFIESLGNNFEEMGYIVDKQPVKKGFIPDMILHDKDKLILVECKKSVNENSISQVSRHMKDFDFDSAIIVTLDKVDEKIRELADDNNIKIWDSRDLDKLKKILRC